MHPRLLTRSTPDYWAVALVWPRGTLRARLAQLGPLLARLAFIGGTLAAIHYLPSLL
ncbi:MAG: hypothetical protein HOQ02_04645 [Lysobacter sp.]|nr:hypothetical protein [Lysobacter sp.]